ncbi:hypothetical protein BDQ12DRAFT_732985 [Crucibulum laeve]|uniref:Cora-like Mg2+ transporter protein-domain-containing protein n=1 Tax=Crucibulum laeve TaxID=68775 RepID=A0A5C3M9N8_9AGAR|nr:hypothetical protein BDQ12DRAFT_732985 [Crucibulum laeve]
MTSDSVAKSLKFGNSSFTISTSDGQDASITGLYTYWNQSRSESAYVWFFHDINAKTSTYIMHECVPEVKELIISSSRNLLQTIHRPCLIDTFVVEHMAYVWMKLIAQDGYTLANFEDMPIASRRTNEEMVTMVEQLHSLARSVHVNSAHLVDIHVCLQFITGINTKYLELSSNYKDDHSVADSLTFVSSCTDTWTRWATNFAERIHIRINLFFNLTTQNDSRTNIDIANLTAKIAVETQRDSSSMITMASVTMFFLPGTFVSALFSMVFFNSGFDSLGRPVLSVAPQWWYFPAITIPLTVLVFCIWVLWQRWRNSSTNVILPSQVSIIEKNVDYHSS